MALHISWRVHISVCKVWKSEFTSHICRFSENEIKVRISEFLMHSRYDGSTVFRVSFPVKIYVSDVTFENVGFFDKSLVQIIGTFI